MFGLVLNALRARRAQTIALFALTVLAGLGASAAPWYAGWARDASVDANITTAPARQRIVTATGAVRYSAEGASPVGALRDRVAAELAIPGAEVVVGARLYTNMRAAGGTAASPTAGLYLNYRDAVCAQLTIEGGCPSATDEVLLSQSTAAELGLAVGDSVRFEGFRLPAPVTLRISGLYEIADLLSLYWAGSDLLAGPIAVIGAVVEEPAFLSEAALYAAVPDGLDMDLHLVLPESAFHATEVDLPGQLAQATGALRQSNIEVRTEATTLIDQIARDRTLVALGVLVAATQLVLLCWLGLFLAVRHTSDGRRTDIGLLKLRGATPWRIWALTAQQSGLPMLAGALVGWALGYLAAGALAGSLVGPARITAPGASLLLSLGAAGLACLGALVAAVVAEWRTLGAPVVTLLRSVPSRHRGWRADVVDLVVVLIAVVGIYQGHAELTRDGEPSVLALLAPALVGLAVALLVARALPAISTRTGTAALRAGRPGLALAALHLARRPGTNRIFAVLAVSVAVFTTVVLFGQTATVAWQARAEQELGAARVLDVRAPSSAHLLRAVREVDPEGRYAMAVARTEAARTEDRVVAVDTTRLARVALADGGAARAARLHPAVPAAPMIADGPLTLDAVGPAGLVADESIVLRLHLSTVDGIDRTLDLGPLVPGRRTYPGTVTGCGPGCRLAALELIAPRLIANGKPAAVEVDGLTGVDPALLGDVTRWRPPLGPVGIGPVVSTRDSRLTIALYTGPKPPGQRIDARVMVSPAPAPLPVVLAGARPAQHRAGDDRITVLGGTQVPYQVVETVPVLPRVGATGVLVDLEYAQRSNDAPGEAAVLEVWLTADAPDAILAGLRDRGVRILAEETVENRTRQLSRHGPGLALRFQLFAAGVVLLLAAGTVVVASTVDRRSRVEELGALRAQGLAARQVTVAGYAGISSLVGVALVTGALAALIAQVAVTAELPVFADGWRLLPLPSGVGLLPLLAALLAGLVALGLAAVAGAGQVVDAVRRGSS